MPFKQRTEDWRLSLVDKLVDLRGLPYDDPRRKEPAKHGLMMVTRQIGYPREVFKNLPPYQERFVQAVARGRNAYEAVLVGRSAARVRGMWVVALGLEPVELALPSAQVPPAYRRNRAVVCRRRKVEYHEELFGVRVTLPIRTFFDIARDHGFAEGLIAADWLLANGFTAEALHESLVRMGRIRNIAVVRRCIELATSKAESPYESLARAILILAGIANVEPQVTIGSYRVDLLIDGWLVIEIDGDIKYAINPERTIVDENNRQKALSNMGYQFLRYRPQQLIDDPASVINDVRTRRTKGASLRGGMHSS